VKSHQQEQKRKNHRALKIHTIRKRGRARAQQKKSIIETFKKKKRKKDDGPKKPRKKKLKKGPRAREKNVFPIRKKKKSASNINHSSQGKAVSAS